MRNKTKHIGWWIYASVVVLVVALTAKGILAKIGFDASASNEQLGLFLFFAAMAFLPALYYSWVLSRGKPAPALRLPGAPVALLIICHLAVQLTGGLNSPLISAYPLTVFAVTVHAGYRQGALLAVLSVFLGTVSLFFDVGALALNSVLLWAVAPWAAWVVGRQVSGAGRVSGQSGSVVEEKETVSDETVTPHLSQSQGEIFDAGRYIEESTEALFSILFNSSPALNSLMLWWVEDNNLRLQAGKTRQGELLHHISLEPGDGLVGWVLKEKKPMIGDELSETAAKALPYYREPVSVKAFIGLPLFDEGRLVGMIAADKGEDSRIFENEIESLKALGQQVVREAQQAQFAAETEDQSRRYSRLYSVSRELSEDLDRSLLVSKFQQLLNHLVPFDSYYLALKSGESGEGDFEVVSKRGYHDEFCDKFSLSDDTVAGGWMLNDGEVLLFRAQEGAAVPHFLSEGMRDSARSFILVPLVLGNRVTGLLKVDRGEKVSFDQQDKDIAAIFAGQCAIAFENARLYDLHRKRATTDGLTGLFNHRFFQERLAEEIEIAKNENKPLSLALTDIDFFKKFNDSFGHQEGDRVLKIVAETLRNNVRHKDGTPVDIVCRYGGEEFVVILPNCDLVECREVMERVRKTCADKVKGGNDEEQRAVTLSIGICTYPKGATEQRQMIHKADAALYQCKENGRNMVSSYKDIPPDELEKSL